VGKAPGLLLFRKVRFPAPRAPLSSVREPLVARRLVLAHFLLEIPAKSVEPTSGCPSHHHDLREPRARVPGRAGPWAAAADWDRSPPGTRESPSTGTAALAIQHQRGATLCGLSALYSAECCLPSRRLIETCSAATPFRASAVRTLVGRQRAPESIELHRHAFPPFRRDHREEHIGLALAPALQRIVPAEHPPADDRAGHHAEGPQPRNSFLNSREPRSGRALPIRSPFPARTGRSGACGHDESRSARSRRRLQTPRRCDERLHRSCSERGRWSLLELAMGSAASQPCGHRRCAVDARPWTRTSGRDAGSRRRGTRPRRRWS